MTTWHGKCIGAVALVALLVPARAPAYSVLTHEATIDTVWDAAIKPFGKAIPQMTKVAWKKKREEIEQVAPGMTRANSIFNLSDREYEKRFGTDYAKPKGWARIVSFLYRLIPEIGLFRNLGFQAPTARGQYELADRTYDELLEKLDERKFADLSEALRVDLRRHFGANDPRLIVSQD